MAGIPIYKCNRVHRVCNTAIAISLFNYLSSYTVKMCKSNPFLGYMSSNLQPG